MKKNYLIDPHVHTSEVSPCGKIPAREMVRRYSDAGYDGIVITDHYHSLVFENSGVSDLKPRMDYYLAGFRAAREEGAKRKVAVYLGAEITFAGPVGNDFIVFGLTEEFLYREGDFHTISPQEFVRRYAGTGLYLYQAHPFRPGLYPEDPNLLDGMEVYNANPRHDASNHRALAYAKEHCLGMIAGSDAHRAEDIARAGIYLPRLSPDARGLAEVVAAEGVPEESLYLSPAALAYCIR